MRQSSPRAIRPSRANAPFSVAPIQLRDETLGKRFGQGVLLDLAMISQRFHDRCRHMSIIGPHSRGRGKVPVSQELARGREEAFAECISH